MLACKQVFPLPPPPTSQLLPPQEEKAFSSEIAKRALVFSTPCNSSVSLFRFLTAALIPQGGEGLRIFLVFFSIGESERFWRERLGRH